MIFESQYFRCAFFFQTLPISHHFTCSPQVCLGLVIPTTYTATDQVHLWSSYLVAPGWNLFLQVSPNALYTQGTRGIQRWGWLHWKILKGSWKKIVGRYDEWNWNPLARHQGSWKPNLLISPAQLYPEHRTLITIKKFKKIKKNNIFLIF